MLSFLLSRQGAFPLCETLGALENGTCTKLATSRKLMYFSVLTASGSSVPVYTVAWRIMDHANHWSQTFKIAFKTGRPKDVKGAGLIFQAALSELLKLRKVEVPRTGLTAALSSKDKTLDPKSPLSSTGNYAASQLGLQWLPDLFEKDAHRPLHSLCNGPNRDAEVAEKYQARRIPPIQTLIITDDLVTRGATFGDMARALKGTAPKILVLGLALGKNEHRDFAAQWGVEVDNSHVPGEWDQLWTALKESILRMISDAAKAPVELSDQPPRVGFD